MLNKRWGWLLGLMGMLTLLLAFDPPPNFRYPMDGYFALSGTFGELRSNHFHSGLDIKTYGKIRVPIYAAEDGFVYRVKVSPYGYGKAIYLRHADSSFTLYAHLNGFEASVEEAIYNRQKLQERAEQEWYPAPNTFRFKKGDLIAYSGNTGTSGAPHLHFEIRDPQERITNALATYQNLIEDHKPPILQQVAFEPIDSDSRINGRFAKLIIEPQGPGPNYTMPDTLQVEQGRIGIEYQSYDLLDAARNHCGVNSALLYLDDSLIFELDLNKYAFDETRFLNLHIDYGHYIRTKDRLQKAYIDHGNLFSAYPHHENWGMIELPDDAVHQFRLELRDTHGNATRYSGALQYQPAEDSLESFRAFGATAALSYEVKRDVMVLEAAHPPAHFLKGLSYLTPSGKWRPWLADHARGESLYFLMPLDPELYPVEVRDSAGNILLIPGFKDEISPNRNRLVQQDEVQVLFPAQSLFTPTHVQIVSYPRLKDGFSKVYEIGNPEIPVYKSFLVSFAIPEGLNDEHLVVASYDKKKKEWNFAGNKQNEKGDIFASVKSFGSFCLMSDSTTPELRPINFSEGSSIPTSQKTLQLKVEDAFSGINSKSIRASLDGEWILMEYNYMKNRLIHPIRKRPSKGSHDLEISVQDEAGNEVRKQYNLNF